MRVIAVSIQGVHAKILYYRRDDSGGGRQTHTHTTHTRATAAATAAAGGAADASSKRDARGRASGLYKRPDSGVLATTDRAEKQETTEPAVYDISHCQVDPNE